MTRPFRRGLSGCLLRAEVARARHIRSDAEQRRELAYRQCEQLMRISVRRPSVRLHHSSWRFAAFFPFASKFVRRHASPLYVMMSVKFNSGF